jgi:hypothetical protein
MLHKQAHGIPIPEQDVSQEAHIEMIGHARLKFVGRGFVTVMTG